MKNAVKFVSALFLTAGMVVACASGDTSTTTNGGSGNTSGDQTPEACKKGTDACTKCGDNACCDELEACANDMKCNALSNCVNACPTDNAQDQNNCISQCPNINDMPTAKKLEAVVTCSDMACKQQCLCVSDGSACGDCETSKCCDPLATCNTDGACVTLADCVFACAAGDQNCENACGSQSTQQAVDEFNAIITCVGNNCSTQCM